MKAYLGITGSLFAVIGIAHLLRLFVEGHPLSDTGFLAHNLALFLVGGGFGGEVLAAAGQGPEHVRGRSGLDIPRARAAQSGGGGASPRP